MASYKNILDIADKRLNSGEVLDKNLVRDIDSLQALTNDLAADSLLVRYPYDFPMDEVKLGDVPTISKILEFLGDDVKDDPEGIIDENGNVAARSGLDKFMNDFPKKRKEWKKKIVENPSLGERGWKTISDIWKQATIDKMNADIAEERRKAIDGEGFSAIGGMASKFFTPRRYEAIVAGRDPSYKDYLGDAIESGLMMVPAAKYAGAASKIFGAVPKVGGAVANKVIGNKVVSNVVGNSLAPLLSESMDATMRGDDDPNAERQQFSLGDVLMGAATNLGVNFGLAQKFGMGSRVGTGELSRNAGSGAMGKVRQAIENFGKSRAERGLPAPTTRTGKILDLAEMAAPTLLVNRWGSDKDAKVGASLLNMVGMSGVDPSKFLEDIRTEDKNDNKKKRVAGQISKVIEEIPDLDERDLRYLNVIAKNPDAVKFGFAGAPDDFKIWLLEKGNRLLDGTEAKRPIWEVK